MDKSSKKSGENSVFFFFFIPTIMLIIGYLIFLYSPLLSESEFLYIPLFLGLILLGMGFFLKTNLMACKMKILGWGSFSFFWATQPGYLFAPSGDVFNAGVCIIGIYVLVYIGYHEWLSIKKNEQIPCLNWIAGGTFLAGIIYFTIDTGVIPGLKDWLIDVVAAQTTTFFNLIGLEAYKEGFIVFYNEVPITIIFACTAIQSMVLFVGMIGALPNVSLKRKTLAMFVTVIPIYFLNLIRNVSVIFLVGGGITSFETAHNIIAKAGSLIALIVLLFITFKILPELYDEIICLFDLSKRKGPVENFFMKLMGKKAK